MKYDNFSEKELDIINRGKKGELNELDELNFYYHYLKIFKYEYINELENKYRGKNFSPTYIFVVLGAGVLVSISLLLVQAWRMAIGCGLVAISGVTIPVLINSISTYLKARGHYEAEINGLEFRIQEKSLNKNRELEKEKQFEKAKIESKKDPFIQNIVNDIRHIVNYRYDGFERDVQALYTLSFKYMEVKEKLKTLSSSDVLISYPEFNSILIGIENSMMNNIKLFESNCINQDELKEMLRQLDIDADKILSDEEMSLYLPKTEINLKLKQDGVN